MIYTNQDALPPADFTPPWMKLETLDLNEVLALTDESCEQIREVADPRQLAVALSCARPEARLRLLVLTGLLRKPA